MDEGGWITAGALNHVARVLSVPPADVYGVATFYAMFAVEPRAPHVVHVCDDIVCGPRGGEEIAARLADELGPEGTGADACWVRSPCLGLCERAPAVLLQRARRPDVSLAPATAETVTAELARPVEPGPAAGAAADPPADRAFADATVSAPQTRGDRAGLRLLRRVGLVDPESLDDYRAHGGYTALRRAVELGPTRVIREVTDASLTGRGGAAFPTGVKWDGVARAPERPHYLVCNADESEPGTFKDRVLMEADPFGLIEAMTIAGYATGCERGYLYIRGEYPLATRRLQRAIEAARARGLLGDDVLGAGFAFDIELRRGAGAYICGEETALLNSIEGFRGEPRNKPPFPSVRGLFGRPTVINNVETLYNVLEILAIGGPAFASIGAGRSTGTKLFCVAGAVHTPGVYEVDFGTTLRELLALAGGVRGDLRTVLLGGAAGGFVSPDQLDVPLTLEGTREIGATLGSGVVLAVDTSADPRRCCGGSPRSSATSRAGSACPAGSAPCDRRRRWPGWPAACPGLSGHRARPARRPRPGHAGRVDLRARADRARGRPLGARPRAARRPDESERESAMTATEPVLLGGIRRLVTLTVDGAEVRVPEGATILDALHDAGGAGADTPTLCWAPNLTPINACRVCVVEVEGSRPLVPSCARRAEDGMVVRTDTERVRHSRRMVLELLASSADLSQASADVQRWMSRLRRRRRPLRTARAAVRPTATPATPATTTLRTGPPRRPLRSR